MNSDFRIIAYAAGWRLASIRQIPFTKLTHINYAFAVPSKDGSLLPIDHPSLLKELVRAAHENHVKVLISVGGWCYEDKVLAPTFVEATNTFEKQQKLSDEIVNFVLEYDLDGADIDWEHPYVSTGASLQYEAFVCMLSAKLKKINKLFTCAVLAGTDPLKQKHSLDPEGFTIEDGAAGHTDTALSCFDFVNIMSYDGGDGPLHSSYEFAVSSAQYWLKTRKVPSQKLNLGLPFYGRPGWIDYNTYCKTDKNAPYKDICNLDGVDSYYNGLSTIKQKTAYALSHLGGVMIWEITQDCTNEEYSLLNAIFRLSQNPE